ncbi:hypothetical protein NQZ68_008061 [Dissostichus eleginoides]|nr:hypothetical protein NQZ68_008061 [Dissostichus eleginoides]
MSSEEAGRCITSSSETKCSPALHSGSHSSESFKHSSASNRPTDFEDTSLSDSHPPTHPYRTETLSLPLPCPGDDGSDFGVKRSLPKGGRLE